MLKDEKSANRNEHQNRKTEVFWLKNRKTDLNKRQNRKIENPNVPLRTQSLLKYSITLYHWATKFRTYVARKHLLRILTALHD